METLKPAVFVKYLDGWNSEAMLVKLTEPVRFSFPDGPQETRYVIISAIHFPKETLIFPSDADGNVLSFMELYGSCRGLFNHEIALNNLGYFLED